MEEVGVGGLDDGDGGSGQDYPEYELQGRHEGYARHFAYEELYGVRSSCIARAT